MSHDEIQDRLLDLLYGELPPREARQVEDHAASCEACRAELERMRATRRLMAALPEEPAPERGERILVAAAREAARRRAARPWLPRWAWASAVAASLVAVGAVSYRLVAMRPDRAGREDPQALMGDSPYAREGARDARTAEAPAEAQRRAEAQDAAKGASDAPASKPGAVSGPPSPSRGGGARAAAGGPPSPPRSAGEGRGEGVSPPARRFAEPPPPEAEPPPRAAPLDAEAPAAAAAPPPPPAPRSRRTEAAPEAESRAASAPPQAADEASGAHAEAAAGARAKAAAPAAPAAVLRYRQLRGAGSLRGEVQTFPGCDGEAWRKVERDPSGRVVSYAREGRLDGRRVRVEAIYGPDGAPARVTVVDAATLEPVAGASSWVPRAEEADGPPRCGP